MANGHGGARGGAGRPRGSKSAKTLAIADRAAAEGITPLEVILKAMRHHLDAGNLDRAAEFAKDAAPYVHPRLGATHVTGGLGVRLEVVEEIVDAPADGNPPADGPAPA